MRQHGARSTLRGLGSHDHACLLYDDDAAFAGEVRAFVRDGLAAGEKVMFLGTPPAELDPAVEVVLQEDAYEDDLDPVKQTAAWEAAVGDALAFGYTGLRTVAEVTGLLVEEESRRRQLHWEACCDRMMAELPWTAMCCYDRRRLPVEALRDVAAMHPIECGDTEPVFRLFCDGRSRLALAGELDAFESERFGRLAALAAPERPFELDLTRLDFADHHGVRALSRLRDSGVSVRGAPPGAQRVAAILGVALY